MATRDQAEFYRRFIIDEWRMTENLGAPHHSRSIRDGALVDFIASRMADGIARGTDPPTVAGTALWQIVSPHPFSDCNHRSGYLVCRVLMEQAGWRLNVTYASVVTFVRAIDRLGFTRNRVVQWVRDSFTPA